MAATLAESFLADLDDLSDDEGCEGEAPAGEAAGEAAGGGGGGAAEGDDRGLASAAGRGAVPSGEALADVAPLHGGPRLAACLAAIAGAEAGGGGEGDGYDLLMECNALAVALDAELAAVGTWLKERYRPKFPELESLVAHAVDYARLVKAIKNETDLTLVDLAALVPSTTVMVVTVTASTTAGAPLPEEDLREVLEGCDVALGLDDARQRILGFVQAQMGAIAPNLTAVVGSEVAAKLMGVAGGLTALSKIPAGNVQLLGQKRKALAGMSSASAARAGELHAGFVFECDVVQKETPPALRQRAARLVGSKCTLMARVDAFRSDSSGDTGERMLAEIRKKIEQWQEPPPAKQVKPLPAPDANEKKNRRGGRRLRAQKERYGITDMQKARNRVGFNEQEEEIGYTGEGMGQLGGGGGSSGRLRVAAQSKKAMKLQGKKYLDRKYGANSAAVSGLSSSLAFTPIQGIELVNPNQTQTLGTGSGTDSVFSEFRGFAKVRRDLHK